MPFASAVAYDDTRTACVTATSSGGLIFRERVAKASRDSEESVQKGQFAPSASASEWSRECAVSANEDGVAITHVALSDVAHGRVIAAAAENGEITFWRVYSASSGGSSSVEQLGRSSSGMSKIQSIAFAPASDVLTLAVARDDGSVRFYEPRERLTATAWEEVDVYESARPGGKATSIAWRRSSEMTNPVNFPILAVGTSWPDEARHSVSVLAYDAKYRRWNLVAEMSSGLATSVQNMSWSAMTTARGALDLAAASGSKCFVYEFTGVTTSSVEMAKEMGVLAHPCEINNCEWNASGSVVATAATDGNIRMWSANMKDGVWREQTKA